MKLREKVVSQAKPQKTQEMIRSSSMVVPVSGIWRPDHDDCGSIAEIWLRKDGLFPHCPCCGRAANFVLAEEIAHISEDPDFQ